MLAIPQLGWALFAWEWFLIYAVARALFLARAISSDGRLAKLRKGGIWDGEKIHDLFRRRAGLACRFD
jgi:hypothetical protein